MKDNTQQPTDNAFRLLVDMVKGSRKQARRSMLQFAEEEIIIPNGPFKGRHFSRKFQPFAKIWFDGVDSGKWPRHAITGPTQSGKSLIGFIIPTLYYLFECQEAVVFGLPDMDMSGDKWKEDILPVLEATRYIKLLPTKGAGSKGGKFSTIKFLNGATLKCMSAGGGDKSRAGFTARVACLTEVNGYNPAGNTTAETDKCTQMESRLKSFKRHERAIFLECTETTEDGKIHQELITGTNTRILCPCPHCGKGVCPERDHLLGWQDATNVVEASKMAYFVCPECGKKLTDKDRYEMNQKATGDHQNPPESVDTHSLRWNAFNNLLTSPGDIGAEEWAGKKLKDEGNEAAWQNKERELTQFLWANTFKGEVLEVHGLNFKEVMQRKNMYNKGIVPKEAEFVAIGVDMGKFLLHYVALAVMPDGSKHVIDYGISEIASASLGVHKGSLTGLRTFWDAVSAGYMREDGEKIAPLQVWYDSGWAESQDAVYEFCRTEGVNRHRPIKGFGVGQYKQNSYFSPKQVGNDVLFIGENYHFSLQIAKNIVLVNIDADYWKSKSRNALEIPPEEAGSIRLYNAVSKNEHIRFTKHIMAEVQEETFVPGKGMVTKWVTKSKNNHLGDALYIACAASHYCALALESERQAAESQKRRQSTGEPSTTRGKRKGLVSRR